MIKFKAICKRCFLRTLTRRGGMFQKLALRIEGNKAAIKSHDFFRQKLISLGDGHP